MAAETPATSLTQISEVAPTNDSARMHFKASNSMGFLIREILSEETFRGLDDADALASVLVIDKCRPVDAQSLLARLLPSVSLTKTPVRARAFVSRTLQAVDLTHFGAASNQNPSRRDLNAEGGVDEVEVRAEKFLLALFTTVSKDKFGDASMRTFFTPLLFEHVTTFDVEDGLAFAKENTKVQSALNNTPPLSIMWRRALVSALAKLPSSRGEASFRFVEHLQENDYIDSAVVQAAVAAASEAAGKSRVLGLPGPQKVRTTQGAQEQTDRDALATIFDESLTVRHRLTGFARLGDVSRRKIDIETQAFANFFGKPQPFELCVAFAKRSIEHAPFGIEARMKALSDVCRNQAFDVDQCAVLLKYGEFLDNKRADGSGCAPFSKVHNNALETIYVPMMLAALRSSHVSGALQMRLALSVIGSKEFSERTSFGPEAFVVDQTVDRELVELLVQECKSSQTLTTELGIIGQKVVVAGGAGLLDSRDRWETLVEGLDARFLNAKRSRDAAFAAAQVKELGLSASFRQENSVTLRANSFLGFVELIDPIIRNDRAFANYDHRLHRRGGVVVDLDGVFGQI